MTRRFMVQSTLKETAGMTIPPWREVLRSIGRILKSVKSANHGDEKPDFMHKAAADNAVPIRRCDGITSAGQSD
jgi:hypothetical protein